MQAGTLAVSRHEQELEADADRLEDSVEQDNQQTSRFFARASAGLHALSIILSNLSRGPYNQLQKCKDFFEVSMSWPDRDFRHPAHVLVAVDEVAPMEQRAGFLYRPTCLDCMNRESYLLQLEWEMLILLIIPILVLTYLPSAGISYCKLLARALTFIASCMYMLNITII